MCNHVYTADYGTRPATMGTRCPYPEFYRALAAAGGEAVPLPIDGNGACLFHSGELEWKRANDLPGAFLRLVRLLDVHDASRFYDFAEFVFVGTPAPGRFGGTEHLFRIADIDFPGTAYFTAARFVDRVEMERVRFPSGIQLEGATFERELAVLDSVIKGAGMSGARFDHTRFVRVEFASYAFFDDARFTGRVVGGGHSVHFAHSVFRGLTNFAHAVFDLGDSSAAFQHVRFEEFTDFRGTRFDCHAEFLYVTFADTTDFIDTVFGMVRASARYVGAAAEFAGIRVTDRGVLTFRSSDPANKLFVHDVVVTFDKGEPVGTVYFENVNLTSFVNGSRQRLLELAREGRVQIGPGCIKYRVQTPLRTVPVEEGNAPLVVELCQTFANYFSASHGLSLGVEIVTRDRTRVSFFYYTDEDVSEAEFLDRLAQTERGLWNLLAAGPPAPVLALPGPGGEAPGRDESVVINAVDGLSAMLGTFFRVGARIAIGRWRETDTRALLGAIRFNEDAADLRAVALHRTLAARYTESTLMGLNRQQNAHLVPIALPAPSVPARVRILFVGANSQSRPLDLELEVSRIQNSLRGSIEGARLELKQVPAATVDTLLKGMLEESPAYVHFSGHGQEAGILLRDELGAPRLVAGEPLAELFRQFRDTVRCVVLNSCFSVAQGRAIRRYIPHVIGMSERILDTAAVAFSTGFYAAIGAGRDVPAAFQVARARVGIDDPESVDLLTLL